MNGLHLLLAIAVIAVLIIGWRWAYPNDKEDK